MHWAEEPETGTPWDKLSSPFDTAVEHPLLHDARHDSDLFGRPMPPLASALHPSPTFATAGPGPFVDSSAPRHAPITSGTTMYGAGRHAFPASRPYPQRIAAPGTSPKSGKATRSQLATMKMDWVGLDQLYAQIACHELPKGWQISRVGDTGPVFFIE